MAYDPYTDARVLDWSWESQCALWRSRAIHQAERASKFRALAEALQKGDTITASEKEPAL